MKTSKRSSCRNPAHETISHDRAERIRACAHASEKAREIFDPKRYKRGGGYTPAEVRKIEEIAGCKEPTNEERSALEVYDFVHALPDKYFFYINAKDGTATTWMGDVLGRVSIRRKYGTEPLSYAEKNAARIPIVVKGVNGVTYTGTYYAGAGDYARVKRSK